MNLSCDSTSANNKSNEEVCVEVPVKNLIKENDLNCLKHVTNELKVVNPLVICNKDNINEVISHPKKIGAGSNIIKNLVNTVDGELRNNKTNDDNPNNSVISNTTKCCIVAPIDVGAQDNITNHPKAIEMEDEEYKANQVRNLHENTEESQLKKAQAIAKPVMVQCFQNIDVVSSSTDNNSAKECDEFDFEVPLTNIEAGTEKTHSEDVVVLEDEVKDNKPDSTLSGAVDCDNTDVHSSDHINKEPVYATGSDKIDSNNTIITKARNKKIFEKKTHSYMECIKTIVLDDEQVEGDSEIIELDDKDNDCDTVEATSNKCNRQIYHNKGINIKRRHQYDEIYQCNTEMAELIEICLNMPNTDGMTRIIDKTLIPIFKDTAPDFKKSEEFKRALTKTITLLERHPLKKFSHIKNFCDILKKHKIKKRVSFITLEKKGGSEDSESNSNLAAKRRKVDAVIDLDDDNDVQVNETNITVHKKAVKEYPPIEIDDESSSDILMENGFVLIDSDHDDEVIIVDKKNNSNHTEPKRKRKHKRKNSKQSHKKFKEYKDEHKKWRENKQKQNKVSCVSVECNLRTKINDDILRTNSNDANKTNQISMGFISDANGETNSRFQNEVPMSVGDLLMPRADKVMSSDHSDSETIKSIEAQIARLKCRLDMYELMEVTSDTRLSPYLVCEQLKALIVRLYKQLCKLTGTAEVKRHEVRLKVMPGHPEGPVRCFEEFLNQNINAEGNPPFPDIQDVIECVCRANYKYEMNLTQTQIMGEAHALFTQFGQEMQKRRQRREWKDLMSLVKQEMVDPANEDPVLQARLAENSLIAKKNEDDLLERYVNMERGIEHDPELRMDIEQSESDDSDMGVDPSEVDSETNTINCLPIISTVCTVNELDCNIVTEPTSSTPVNNHESESDDFDMGVDPSEVDNEANTINSLPIISTVCTVNELDCNIVTEPTSRTPVDNHPEFVNDALNLRTQRFGSKISISGGNIIIEPTINAIPNTVGFEPKMTGMKAQSKSESDLVKDCMRRNAVVALNKTEFSSEFQHFIANIESKKRQAQEKVLIEKRNAHIRDELSQKECTNYANMTADNTEITSNSAQSKLETASALAKTILSLVQSETNINETSITNNSGQVDGEFEIFTHIDVWKPVHINTELDKNKGSNSNAINKELNNATFVNVAQNFNTHSAEVSKDADPQIESDVDNEERIVKSEPLDIPSMLEELGKDFSATIFDIEGAEAFRDPFLVIDISDSSDSEAENI